MERLLSEPAIKRFLDRLADESGQNIAEYGIALAIIALGAAAVAALVAGDVAAIWEASRDAIQNVIN